MHSLFEDLLFFEYLKDYHVAFFALGNLFLSSVTWPFKHTKNCLTTDRKLSFLFLMESMHNLKWFSASFINCRCKTFHFQGSQYSCSEDFCCNLIGLWRNCRGWKFWHDLLKEWKLYLNCVFAKGLDLMFFCVGNQGIRSIESTIIKSFNFKQDCIDGDLKRECPDCSYKHLKNC